MMFMVLGNRRVPTGRPNEFTLVAAMVTTWFDNDEAIEPQLREFADREGFVYGMGQDLACVAVAASL